MESSYTTYNKAEFIETDTGNKVSRRSLISGSQNIVLGGKTIVHSKCTIRGDLRRAGPTHQAAVLIGRFCSLGEASVLRPPYKTYKGVFSYYPMKIGDHVDIGANTIVEAASIGSHVRIGKNCDCCEIEDGAVIAPNTVIPPFSVVANGPPARIVAQLPESIQDVIEAQSKDKYARFVPA
ncbi:trimeric LpxA-like protein [Linderina pennispora]|uniref:Dynactin subunit 5 n=1 Tax=Linderina pennispora TaxID=61395 RepID=A0A1Y1VVR5_9FUNG|nr:trimeric LpxA-like protein [Linderina pennispora]ORX65086.1 trimeric LpxA-like protein [Linderina pennispora]